MNKFGILVKRVIAQVFSLKTSSINDTTRSAATAATRRSYFVAQLQNHNHNSHQRCSIPITIHRLFVRLDRARHTTQEKKKLHASVDY